MALKVKVFDEEHEEDLEHEMNRFLQKIDERDVIEVKFQVGVSCDQEDDQIFCFSAMIIYRA
ncbi:sporulation protein Cse60 [Bacillus timonensis]|uniref:sporulation protein Cse60 n=1 Tax=Bacillus timonensis TaxID=1033734 RepID=UPI00028983D0|nr:sporulation protein Cse60 [Bacillus timonensis]